MTTKIPEQLKADLPANTWGKVLGSTPVVMAVVATLLAGLASSEMTRAQYDRSLAAQLQSKAGDQWGLFQAKKLRSTLQRDTLDLLASSFPLHPMASAAFPDSAPAGAAIELLLRGARPKIAPAPTVDGQSDSAALDRALRAAENRAAAFDAAIQPFENALSVLEGQVDGMGDKAGIALHRDFTALRLRQAAWRYETEARLNQTIATLYEFQVARANRSAERHHHRSQQFFYGMLVAQLAVIIATFALAARQRSLLWSLAAAAGLGALSFAVYVYLAL